MRVHQFVLSFFHKVLDLEEVDQQLAPIMCVNRDSELDLMLMQYACRERGGRQGSIDSDSCQ